MRSLTLFLLMMMALVQFALALHRYVSDKRGHYATHVLPPARFDASRPLGHRYFEEDTTTPCTPMKSSSTWTKR